MPHSLLTFQDISLKCNPHSGRQLLLVSSQVLGIRQRWYGGSAAESSKSSGCGVVVNHDLLQNKKKLLSPHPVLTQKASWTEKLNFFVTLSYCIFTGCYIFWSESNRSASMCCLHVLSPFSACSQGEVQGSAPCMFPFRGSLYQKFLCHLCPWQLIPGAKPQADATGATITSQGQGKGLSFSQKMCRQPDPWPIFSAQNLEQLQVFAFVLGLNMCLPISQSYLRCRGVVRLHNLTQPVTSHRWISCLQKSPLPPSFRWV